MLATHAVGATAQTSSITPRGPATSAAYASESTTSIVLAVPAGTLAGDVLIASLGFGITTATAQPVLSAPVGWTLVTRTNQGAVGTLAVFWHVFATGDTNYTWTTSAKVGGAAFLAAFGGVDTSNPVDVTAGLVTLKSVTATAPSVTTTAANDLLVTGYFGYRGSGQSTTWTPPAGMTELGDANNGSSRSGCLDAVAQPASGPSGTKTATASSRQDYTIAVTTALRAAAAPPDTTPPVISGVSAGGVTASAATVSWTTDEASDSQVDFGLSSSYGTSTPLATALVTAHTVALSGLTASTAYHFRVDSRDAAGNLATSGDFTLTTAAADTTPPVISGVSVGGVTTSAATVSWTTDEASDSRVDYGLSTAYGSSASAAALVTAHSVALSGLSSGTAYHYRVNSRDASGNLATSGDATFTTSAPPPGAVPVIVDTDVYSDADDVGALAIAFGLQLKGEATVVAVGVNTRTDRPAVATNSWKCVAAIDQFYGYPNVPIGSDMPDNGTDPTQYDFIGPCAQLASPSTPAPDTAVNVYRRALAAAPDGSVVVIGIGYEENLSALLSSPSDAISPLSGHDLVARKVRTLVVMGGGYPSRASENNLAGNPAAAQAVAGGWPTKIVWSGYEVGDAVHTGQTISSVHPANSPVRVAYEAFVGPNNWVYSYDLTAVYHAVRPGDSLLTEVGPGTNVIDGSGGNVFTLGPGSQYYLSLTSATSLDSAIEALLDTLPAPAPDTTPPVISAVAAGAITVGGATITWTTNEGSDSQVDYGLTTAYGSSSALATPLVTSHSVALSGLAAATTFHYRVRSRDAAGNLATSADGTFTTASTSAPGPNDTFDSNVIDPSSWAVVQEGSSVTAANQELEMTHPASTTWTKGTLQSAVQYDQTGKSVQIQVRRAANNGQGGSTYGETSIYLWLDSTHYVEFFIAGSAITAWDNNGGGDVNLTPSWPAYSATNMQWLRFRESGGTMYWEYASGATAPGTWTTLASATDPFPMTAVILKIVAGSNVATTDVAEFDNISTY